MRSLNRLITAALTALLLSCAPAVRPPPAPPQQPAGFPEEAYRQAAGEDGKRVYRVDGAGSLLTMRVRRTGKLARMGHDHVVASRHLAGYVLLNPGDGECRGDLYVPVDQLSVDEALLRERAGLDTTLSSQDVAATRRNMRVHVFESEQYPFVEAQVADCDADSSTFELHLTLHGKSQTLRLSASRLGLDRQSLQLEGGFSVRQSAFDITPYCALGGLLCVADGIEIQYRIEARRLAPGGGD